MDAAALIERLSCYGYSIRPNDPCADTDDDLIERVVNNFLSEASREVEDHYAGAD